MSVKMIYDAEEALKKLKEGNEHYLAAETNEGDISLKLREKTYAEGQNPYAIIVVCSDSRVIPESIFNAGIGELFVIRVAGNVIGEHQLGSIEYALEHLACRLIVVMGHNNCGAVGSVIKNNSEKGYIKFVTDEIKAAIGEEKDNYTACCLNVRHSMKKIEESLEIGQREGLLLQGAMYHLEDGRVEFL